MPALGDALYMVWFAALLLAPVATLASLVAHLHNPEIARAMDLGAVGVGVWIIFFPIGCGLALSHLAAFVEPAEALGSAGVIVLGFVVGVPCTLVSATAHVVSKRRARRFGSGEDLP